MKEKELYFYLLGLSKPWFVSDFDFSQEEKRVDIRIEHEPALFTCPECGTKCSVYDHAPERVWRHLDSCNFKTYIHAKIPRVNCQEHGILQSPTPWAEPNSRYTLMFEQLALSVLQECTIAGAAKILRVSWGTAWNLMEKAVQRGLNRKKSEKLRYLGVDEKSNKKGHNYFTLIYNIDKGTVEHIADERSEQSLRGYYQGLSQEQRSSIEAVAMDMWKPYIKATEAMLGPHKIVIDRFHVMKHMNRAVNEVRKKESRELDVKGDNSLKRTKYLWLYAGERIPENCRESFAELKKQELKVGKAWSIKEALRHLWQAPDLKSALRYWLNWDNWSRYSGLEPVCKAAQTIGNHMPDILTYFWHRITNATSEGLNSKIQKIKAMACGYRNKENFKTAIYFHCGGLELYP
jgi:transposase